MDQTTIIVIAAILALITLAVMMRYRHKAEAWFSVHNLFKFGFRGNNEGKEGATQEAGVRISRGAQVAANDVVGRDKITYITSPPAHEPPMPKLSLKLFRMDDRKRQDEIAFNQAHDQRYLFGFALENEVEATVAERINIRVEIAARFEQIKLVPRFDVWPRAEGWQAEVNTLVHNQPAILVYRGSDRDRCAYGDPLQWFNFTVELSERIYGFFLLQYKVSSAQPVTHGFGELKIHLH